MARARTIHRCAACGAVSPQWAGRCASCEAWNALVEEVEDLRVVAGARGVGRPAPPTPITEVDSREHVARSTTVGELDRVLGGGLVPGSVTLLGGEPGIGKSTLLLAVVAGMAAAGCRCLYVSGEESTQQVHARAERVGALHPALHLSPETNLAHVLGAVDAVAPDVVVIDSIQTMVDPDVASAPGSITQVRECAHRLVQAAKAAGTAVLLVGHVTKDGGFAGPRVLEHVVDTVLAFEGERHHALRLLRAVKHRFGSTHELGLFEMSEAGLLGVPDPSGLFLADRCAGVAGSAVVPTVEGHRPLLIEVQALVASAASPANARRSAHGVDHGRLAMLLAVLEQRVGLALAGTDVYASAVGGVRLTEPGADLGICLAIASALADQPLPEGLAACGEVGLGGELRQVAQTPRRLAEAARLGFSRVIVPASAPNGVRGIDVERVPTLRDAIALALAGAAPVPERAARPRPVPARAHGA